MINSNNFSDYLNYLPKQKKDDHYDDHYFDNELYLSQNGQIHGDGRRNTSGTGII